MAAWAFWALAQSSALAYQAAPPPGAYGPMGPNEEPAGERPDPGCFLSVERDIPEREEWSASCPSLGSPIPRVSGRAINRLDAPITPDCGPGAACFQPIGTPITTTVPFPVLRTPATAPQCIPRGSGRIFAPVGFLDIHRSCFRALSGQDRSKLRAFGQRPGFRPGAACRLDKFGELGVDPGTGAPLNVPEHQPWARQFLDEYPQDHARGSPSRGTAAEAIHEAFMDISAVADPGGPSGNPTGCLAKINPDLAYRLRQAMGVENRAGSPVAFRPVIKCMESEEYFCQAPGFCAENRAKLQEAYRNPEGLGPYREARDAILANGGCRPAHSGGETLGSITNPPPPGVVSPTSPEISLSHATALFNQPGSGGKSTLFHELLHAAGAFSSPDHNHGTADDVVPANDQVYACQAVAFSAFFSHLTDAELMRACVTCAQMGGNPAVCAGGAAGLRALGCRL